MTRNDAFGGERRLDHTDASDRDGMTRVGRSVPARPDAVPWRPMQDEEARSAAEDLADTAGRNAARFGRWRRLLTEILQFLAVGGAAYLVDVGLSNLLVYGFIGFPAVLHDGPLKAKIVSTVVSVGVAWIGNKFWTYGKRSTGSSTTGLWSFLVVNALGMVIVIAPLGLTWYVLGLRDPISYNISTNIVGIGLAMVFRFWAYRTFVFRDRPRVEKLDLDTSAGVEAHSH